VGDIYINSSSVARGCWGIAGPAGGRETVGVRNSCRTSSSKARGLRRRPGRDGSGTDLIVAFEGQLQIRECPIEPDRVTHGVIAAEQCMCMRFASFDEVSVAGRKSTGVERQIAIQRRSLRVPTCTHEQVCQPFGELAALGVMGLHEREATVDPLARPPERRLLPPSGAVRRTVRAC
jgi:hypothetical protein